MLFEALIIAGALFIGTGFFNHFPGFIGFMSVHKDLRGLFEGIEKGPCTWCCTSATTSIDPEYSKP